MAEVFVQVDGKDVCAGTLSYRRSGRGSGYRDEDGDSRFVYDEDYFVDPRAYDLGPDLPRRGGREHVVQGLPLALRDAAPDYWGAHLLDKAEKAKALTEDRDPQRLDAFDRLCGASDATRQGAIRIRDGLFGEFLADDVAVPHPIELDDLLRAADNVLNGDDWEATKRLLDAGTGSLGGARPKAAVTKDGTLWLAKFPRTTDETNVPLWEMVALDIAQRAGITTPAHELLDVGGRQVLLSERFDRNPDGSRTGYASLRTLANNPHHASLDYTDTVEILSQEHLNPRPQIEMAYRHAVLDIALNNTDNHDRNHGFVRSQDGWSVSPVFDLDPNPDTGAERGTSIGASFYRHNAVRGLTKLRAEAGLTDTEARAITGEVLAALEGWQARAASYGADERSIDQFSRAFANTDLVAYANGH